MFCYKLSNWIEPLLISAVIVGFSLNNIHLYWEACAEIDRFSFKKHT